MKYDRDALLDRPPEAAVRTLALAALDDAEVAARRLEKHTRAAALHDFRVALRRLRTLFKSYRGLLADSVSRKQARALRALASRTGGARDAEVQLEALTALRAELEPGAAEAWSWIVERLEARRESAHADLRGDVLERFDALATRLRVRLSRYRASVAQDAARATFALAASETVRRAGAELCDALRTTCASSDFEQAHRTRIRAKRLRYLVEPLRGTALEEAAAPLVVSLRALQDLLGGLNDLHVLAGELSATLVQAASERARALHEALYSAAVVPVAGDPTSGILAIDRLVRDRIEARFRELRARWGGDLAPFSAAVETFAAALSGHVQRVQRRRFLLAALPAAEGVPLEITQGWIPGVRRQERLKRVVSGGEERFYLVKGGSEREVEEETGRVVFERLWTLTEGRQVLKRRYRIAEGERIWEVDDFLERGLVIAESELAGTPGPVELPPWLRPLVVHEVTGEDRYLDENLAQ